MFYIQGVGGQLFHGTMEQLNRVNGVSRGRNGRMISTDDDEIGAEAPSSRQRDDAVRAYRQMLPPEIDRGPLYHADQLMSRPVIVVNQNSDVAEAWRTLRDNNIHEAPVVNDEQQLIGLVSERDLLTAVDVEAGEVIAARQRRVKDVMTTPVVAADPVTDIRRVAAIMLHRGVEGVPVIAETGRIIGFVSRSDILRAVVNDPPLSLWR